MGGWVRGELQKGSELLELDFTVLEGCRIRFPWLSITNSYSFCGPKQHKCIPSQFWTQKFKIKVSVWPPSLQGPPCLFQLLRAPAVFGLWQHHLISAPVFTRLLLSVLSSPLVSLRGTAVIGFGGPPERSRMNSSQGP